MGTVIQLFQGKDNPEPEGGGAAWAEFMEDHFWDAVIALDGLAEAGTDEEYRAWRDELRQRMSKWPT